MKTFLKGLKWIFIGLVVLFVILVVYRVIYFFNLDKTNAQVAKIHATKLTLDDVMGKNLPPDPGAEADKNVQGIDANNNGIRDDVELAIFEKYPNSAKTRAVLLQYALALQMEVIQIKVNTSIVDAVADYGDRSNTCIADTLVPRKNPKSGRSDNEMEKIYTYINLVEDKQLNLEIRKKAQHDFYQGNLKGYDKSNKPACDLDIALLPN